MISGCVFCKNYDPDWRDCNKRQDVTNKLKRIGEPVDLVDWFLKGKKKVKELINGKKTVNCPGYKFDSDSF